LLKDRARDKQPRASKDAVNESRHMVFHAFLQIEQ
jgi:hypothetical protein